MNLLKDKKIAVVLVLIMLLFLGLGLYVKSRKPAVIKPTPQVETPKLVKTEESKAEMMVQITSKGFIPQTLQMKKGGVVKFINTDNKPHQVMSDPHPTHNLYPFLNTDEILNKGESVTVIVEQGGTFTYHDHLDPLRYKGVIKIVDK